MHAPQVNLLLAWLWMLLGFLSGMVLGMFFHREGWLGGYGSFKRRLYRLAHISLFGLGAVNLAFYLTVRAQILSGPRLELAGWAFVLGALSMPACCVLMAHFPRSRLLFSVPVLSLLLGGTLTLLEVAQTGPERRVERIEHPDAAAAETAALPNL